MTDEVLAVTTLDHVAVVTICRPDAMNALNAEVISAFSVAMADLLGQPRVRAIVITGDGDRAFCAGADLKELQHLDPATAHGMFHRGQNLMRIIEDAPIPTIAAINGVALGGGFELALSCTLAVVRRGAALGLPETGLGLMPGYGGTQRLTRRIGSPRAALAMLTGKRLSADEAYAYGVAAAPPCEDALRTAVDIGRQIASQGPRAVRAVLTAMRHVARGDGAGLELETALAAPLPLGAEGQEGIAAFLERRPTKFPDFDTTGER